MHITAAAAAPRAETNDAPTMHITAAAAATEADGDEAGSASDDGWSDAGDDGADADASDALFGIATAHLAPVTGGRTKARRLHCHAAACLQ